MDAFLPAEVAARSGLQGDCDQRAVFEASALAVMGLVWRIVTTRKTADHEAHAFAEVALGDSGRTGTLSEVLRNHWKVSKLPLHQETGGRTLWLALDGSTPPSLIHAPVEAVFCWDERIEIPER